MILSFIFTLPLFVQDPLTLEKSKIEYIKVPNDIVEYCMKYKVLLKPVASDEQVLQEKLKYINCAWKHMGYYGYNEDMLKYFRTMSKEYYEKLIKEQSKWDRPIKRVDEILNRVNNLKKE